MINLDLQKLIQALDADTRRDLETCAQRCVTRGASQVLVEDLLLCLLERPQGLLPQGLRDADVDAGALRNLLQPQPGQSTSRNPAFAPELVQWLQEALLLAHLELGQSSVGEAALLLAVLNNPLAHAGCAYQPWLAKLDASRLKASVDEPGARAGAGSGGDSLLERFTHDLTAQAREGALDPVLCRDSEIARMIDVLARRRKNNPILVGEAGVGKTALAEGLALRIVAGEVPPVLEAVRLLTLDLGLLQAGASVKGEFERRLQGVIDEAGRSMPPVILFIDEAHTLIGSGNQPGAADAANLLKPALARGQLRTIAATTWSEYKRYFEKDPALARRFQPVQVNEPSPEQAVAILRGLAATYERSHGVYIRDDALQAAVSLSARYLAGRQLPDKAVDVLDTACARVRISLASAPQSLARLRGERAAGYRQVQALRRDALAGLRVDRRALASLEARLPELERQLTRLEADWHIQREQAGRLLALRLALDDGGWPGGMGLDEALPEERSSLARELTVARAELEEHERGQRLVSFEVCPRVVAEVVSAWSEVPVQQLAREHNTRVEGFASDLQARIRGQGHAVQALDRAVRCAAAGLNRADAPVGVFLLVGPSGVGKTETARALADLLYGGERFLTTLNMTEFQEKHSLSRLIGAPPGYVGYGEGGMLTEAVRQRPYSVVLLDEVEKADPEVLNLFYQIFDKGLANDGEGREIDFRHTLILLTSNLASEQIEALCADGARPEAALLAEHIRPTLIRHFKPALLARMQVVPYYPIAGEVLGEVVTLKLQRLASRLRERDLRFSYSPRLAEHLSARCRQDHSGARLIDQLLENGLMPTLVDRLLAAMARGERLEHAHADLDAQGALAWEFS
ncbi:type VI secretion system ATPase TssH [Pseudomonas sp. DTU_2021_1001937_2_SI_NGA_ILE_001]|uniref:type VI secretion system ATPase TssH n=1 Tax=Pseudomonas sp. DTU_2021_1001937_2_SI_NGA_ILE_001 TaxID=3077589 RepID=UPI0028FC1DD0|nr:type VI secretion system ATPase TssH [Pseudomonas sp. DTU_2021_1001937_2_SI_NGA_ILE_001]WNW09923.1 type VI secretion system ATPase TssH [Pseudomonas sp. DTU_2021_1001937_2_SI_NGA_ILE_001]